VQEHAGNGDVAPKIICRCEPYYDSIVFKAETRGPRRKPLMSEQALDTDTAVLDVPNASVHDQPPSAGIAVLDLYKVAVEMADRVSARRATANAFFLTAQTAFVAVVGLSTPTLRHAPLWTTLAVSLAGVTMSLCWWLQLRSYRDLNRAKFAVINSIEKSLPIKVYSDELLALESPPRRFKYLELGVTERIIPGVFIALYALLIISRATQ